MADQAKTDATVAVAVLFFYQAANGQMLPFPSIDVFSAAEGLEDRQAILSEVNIQGGTPQGLLAYDVLATAIALKTAKGENFPADVEAKLTALSDALVSTDGLVAAWELVQESHITDQATELLDVPTERVNLIAQIIANNPADFVSTEIAAEAGEMTVTFVANANDGGAEPEEVTEEAVETTTEEVTDPITTEEEAEVEVTDPVTGIIAETTEVSALAHYEAPEEGIVVSEGNVGQLINTLANAAETNLINAQTVKTIAETQASAQRTIELLANAVAKPNEKVTVEAEVVTTPAEA